ncbi:hypothetical protein PCANC_19719 [Puccinia coronata f. sp. avenae]|uniref:Uncharacterized protein n=1 Tax=Puccinia coronata f. sp. avenae TaxID=200324 RepID=A0A2N5SBJ2_9BASI|nr:hypothetical protein PCANC_19719 [Puccinia coronata f. sp. avenae]
MSATFILRFAEGCKKLLRKEQHNVCSTSPVSIVRTLTWAMVYLLKILAGSLQYRLHGLPWPASSGARMEGFLPARELGSVEVRKEQRTLTAWLPTRKSFVPAQDFGRQAAFLRGSLDSARRDQEACLPPQFYPATEPVRQVPACCGLGHYYVAVRPL